MVLLHHPPRQGNRLSPAHVPDPRGFGGRHRLLIEAGFHLLPILCHQRVITHRVHDPHEHVPVHRQRLVGIVPRPHGICPRGAVVHQTGMSQLSASAGGAEPPPSSPDALALPPPRTTGTYMMPCSSTYCATGRKSSVRSPIVNVGSHHSTPTFFLNSDPTVTRKSAKHLAPRSTRPRPRSDAFWRLPLRVSSQAGCTGIDDPGAGARTSVSNAMPSLHGGASRFPPTPSRHCA